MISSMQEPRSSSTTPLTVGSRRKDGLKGIASDPERGHRMRLILSEAEVGQLPADIVEERGIKKATKPTLWSTFFATTGEACVVYDE